LKGQSKDCEVKSGEAYAASCRDAAVARGHTRITGRTAKNLCRQGSQRSAGNPNIRATNAIGPAIYSEEIFCSSRFPQIPQRAYFTLRNNGIARA
jgi:hypothetical protein